MELGPPSVERDHPPPAIPDLHGRGSATSPHLISKPRHCGRPKRSVKTSRPEIPGIVGMASITELSDPGVTRDWPHGKPPFPCYPRSSRMRREAHVRFLGGALTAR